MSPAKRSCMARLWKGFDAKFMKPLLTSARPSLAETLPQFCAPCAQFFTSAEQMGVAVPLNDEGVALEEQAFPMKDVETPGGSLTSGD